MLETSAGEFYTYVIGAPAKPTHQSNTKVCELGLWHQVYKLDGSEGNGWRQIILPSSPTPSSISALKFLDDETFLCLFCHEEVDYLLCLPYRCSSSTADPQNHYRTMDDLAQAGVIAHTFDNDEQNWIPKWIFANGKKKRRNCVVVEESKKKWKIFDLEGFRSGNIDAGAGLMVGSDEDEEGDEEESMVF
jgi:anaphase-promoting complex subunit 4